MPTTKRIARRTLTYAPATGFGIARMTETSLGLKARATKIAPAAIPTERAPTPVSSVTEMLVEYVVFGTVPTQPDRRLPTPSAVTAP